MQAFRVLVINLILSALAISAAWLALLADQLWPFALPQQLQSWAWPLLVLGVLFILTAEYSFITVGHATGAPANPPRTLVTSGLYGWVRNPIYLGADLLFFYLALERSSPTMLLVAIVFLPAMHIFVTRLEEPRLEQRFGAAYAGYRRRVPRWLPRPPLRADHTPAGTGKPG